MCLMLFISCSYCIINTGFGIKPIFCCTKSELPQLHTRKSHDFLRKYYCVDKGPLHRTGSGAKSGNLARTFNLAFLLEPAEAQHPVSEIKRVCGTPLQASSELEEVSTGKAEWHRS